MKYEVTLKDLRQASACYSGYNKLVRSIQGVPFTEEDEERESYIHHAHKEPIPLLFVLESNGLDDALWALRCVPKIDRDARLFAIWCAREVQHLMADPRSLDALDVAERFADGRASIDELGAAGDAARDAARAAAWAAGDAAWHAAWHAAWAAAQAAAWDAAWDAAWAAGDAAGDAAWHAAGDAARDAARDAQAEMFKLMCQGKAEWQTVKALVTH